MARFSPTDAAVEGFRLTRERPAAVAVWALLWFAVYLFLFYRLADGGVIQAFSGVDMSRPPPPEQLTALFAKAASAIAPAFAIWLVVQVLVQAAVLRIVLRPAERGPGGLGLGMDELRLLLVQLAIGAMISGLYLTVVLLAAITGGQPAALSLALVLFLAGGAALLVRLSLAAPMTFDVRRVSVFASLSLTKGLFLPLLGAYLLAFLLNLLVNILGGVIGEAIRAVLGAKQGYPATVGELFHPGFLGFLALQAIFQALGSALLLAPPARVYKALKGEEPQAVF